MDITSLCLGLVVGFIIGGFTTVGFFEYLRRRGQLVQDTVRSVPPHNEKVMAYIYRRGDEGEILMHPSDVDALYPTRWS